jgi:hypothetical protein
MDNVEYKVFMRQVTEIEPNSDFDSVVVSFTKYILELEDAIEVLIDKENSIGAAYVVRGQYEMFLQLGYLIEPLKNQMNECEKRAKSYMYFHLLQLQEWVGKSGKEEDIEKIKTELSNYADIKKERERCKSKYPNWFSLFNGPGSFKGLEEYLGSPKGEEPLYGILSILCHGKATIRDYSMDTKPTINVLVNISDTLKNIFVQWLIPFAISHNIDINKFLSFLSSIPKTK